MTAVTFPLRPPRLAFAICGRRWQNDVYEIKYTVCAYSSKKADLIIQPNWGVALDLVNRKDNILASLYRLF